MTKISLGINDKYGEELFAGDTVRIVNSARSGTVLHNITAAAKAYTIAGDVHRADGHKESVLIAAKKVKKVP